MSGEVVGASEMLIALRKELVVARRDSGGWTAHEHLHGKRPLCVAVDSFVRGRFYCGTGNDGLWLSDDAGRSWRKAESVRDSHITAVAVAAKETNRRGIHSVVYVGTEPSSVHRSDDGGETWDALDTLQQLPSAPTWSFPPRPETHHVRWLEADPNQPGRIYACIEAGALVRSDDRGRTWHDRVQGGPYDTHTLATHPSAPGRLYSAAGDGYFESSDGGDTWQKFESGLRHRYLFSVAVDPGDSERIIVSAAPAPSRAYDPAKAESAIYCKSGRSGGDWQEVRNGLPDERGTTVSALAAFAPGEFWAANNHGVYRSADAGRSWQRISLAWPDAYTRGNVLAFAVL